MNKTPRIMTCVQCRKQESKEICIIGTENELTESQAAEVIRRCEAYEGLVWHEAKKETPPTKAYCHLYIPSVNKHSTFKGWYLESEKVWLTTLKSHTRTNKVTHWQLITLPEQALQGASSKESNVE